MKRFVVEDKFKTALARSGITDCRSAWQYFGEPQAASGKEVVIVQQPLRTGEPVFYKQYDYAPPEWRFIGRRSKARREYDNYAVFRRLDIPCADRVSCGEERDGLGRLRRAFITTAAIAGAAMLPQYCASHNPTRRERNEIIRQLADITRRLHAANFFHHDLVVRNVLVTPEPKVWLIDCPRGAHVRMSREHARIKDLASLDKGATLLTSQTERLSFAKLYLGKAKLDDELKQLIRAELKYRKERWPDDWR